MSTVPHPQELEALRQVSAPATAIRFNQFKKFLGAYLQAGRSHTRAHELLLHKRPTRRQLRRGYHHARQANRKFKAIMESEYWPLLVKGWHRMVMERRLACLEMWQVAVEKYRPSAKS